MSAVERLQCDVQPVLSIDWEINDVVMYHHKGLE